MFKLKASYHGLVHTILVRKDMSEYELTDALVYAMGIPSEHGQIVGFRDNTGIISFHFNLVTCRFDYNAFAGVQISRDAASRRS